MPKKSHRVASRQAAVSRERKRKKRAQTAQRQPMPTIPPTPAVEAQPAEPSAASEPSTVTITQTPPSTRPSARAIAPRYQYVTAEIRKIAILAAVILAILITLTFVLG